MYKLKNLQVELENLFNDFGIVESIEFAITKNKSFDFQINNLVKHNKFLKLNELSLLIKKVIEEDENIEKFEITEKNFINIKLNPNKFVDLGDNFEKYLKSKNPKKLILDYGGPNIGKPLHVGHLRSLNIGRSLYKINQVAGNSPKSDIHLGDWGMPIAQIIGFCSEKKINISSINIDMLEEIYPKASSKYSKNDEFQNLCQEINKKLNEGDKKLTSIWKEIKEISIESINDVLKKLDHSFDLWLGESDVNFLIPKMLLDLRKSKKISIDDGAFISNENKDPKILITKSDGSYLYLTTDLATVKYRLKNIPFDDVLYVVDKRQALHFEQLISSIKYFGFDDKNYSHISFGTINDENGNPFKTRDGGSKKLIDLFDETCDYLKKINDKLSNESIKILANTVLTYSDLITNRKTDYKFDLNRFTSTSGKTGLYVQYALVRAKKLLKEANIDVKNSDIKFNSVEECDLDLFRAFFKLEINFNQALVNSEPHHIADYLYELSNLFNSMYQSESILNNNNLERKTSKLKITWIFVQYSTSIMSMLGIKPVAKM